jgi:hypothetical protein
MSVGSGGTGGEHGGEPSCGRSIDIAVHMYNRELKQDQWEEALLRGFCC